MYNRSMNDFDNLKAAIAKSYEDEVASLKALEVPFGHKICTRCKEIRPIEMFAKSTRYRDGHQYWCKPCVSTYQRDTRTGRPKVLAELMSFPAVQSKQLLLGGRYRPREIRDALIDLLSLLEEMGLVPDPIWEDFGGESGS
jgi:transposase-like protein